MELNEYQKKARATAVYSYYADIPYCSIGLAGEVGEVCNLTKKMLRDDDGQLTESRKEKFKDECGDVLWYLSALCGDVGVTLDDVAQYNLDKLAQRKKENTLRGR